MKDRGGPERTCCPDPSGFARDSAPSGSRGFAVGRLIRSPPRASHHHGQEDGATDEGCDDAGLHLRGNDEDAPQDVGPQEQDRPGHEGDRQQLALVGPQGKPQHLRHHEPDEGYRADGRRRRPAQERDGGQRQGARPCGAHPQGPGLLLPQRQGIEGQPGGQGKHEADGEEGADPHQQAGVAPSERAQDPEAVGVEGLGVVHGDGAGDGAQAGSQRHPGQHQARRPCVGAAAGHEVDESCGQSRPGEGEPEVAADVVDSQDGQRQDDGEGGAGVDAEDSGLGQWVAGQSLHDDSRDGQGGPDDDGQNGARHAHPPDDDGGDGLPLPGEPGENLLQGQAAGPDGEADEDQRRKQHQADEQHNAHPGPEGDLVHSYLVSHGLILDQNSTTEVSLST